MIFDPVSDHFDSFLVLSILMAPSLLFFCRVANKKQLPSAIGAIGGGCGCVDEVIHVAAESTIHPGHGGQRNGNGTQNSGDKV